MSEDLNDSKNKNKLASNPFIAINQASVAQSIPVRGANSYKGDFGHVLCIGGQQEMAGAISLASTAALFSGAGLVTVATAPENFSTIHQTALELMCVNWQNKEDLSQQINQANTLLIGPGLGRNQEAKDIFVFVLNHVRQDQRLVIDADGLYHLSHLDWENLVLPEQTVLTPHLGEWERLTGHQLDHKDWQVNSEFQTKLKATVVLKGSRTQIYTKDKLYQNTTGNPAMAVGGMGDTLAGMISGLLYQYEDFHQAVAAGVYMHSFIADQLAEQSYIVLPAQIIPEIPACMKALQQGQE